jgi:hypothetical protein
MPWVYVLRGSSRRANVKGEEKSETCRLLFKFVEQPRKHSGLVGSSNLPPGNSQSE